MCNHYHIEGFCQECYDELINRLGNKIPIKPIMLTTNPSNEDNSWIKEKFRTDYHMDIEIIKESLSQVKLSLAEVLELLKDYDKENGNYPENEWEGREVAKFLLEKYTIEVTPKQLVEELGFKKHWSEKEYGF